MGDSMFYCSRILRDVHEGQSVVQCSHVDCSTVIDPDKLLRFSNDTSCSIPPGGVCRIRVCEHTEQDICITVVPSPDRSFDVDSNRPDDTSGNR